MTVEPREQSSHRVGGVIAGAAVLSPESETTDVFESPQQMAARLLRLAAEMRGVDRALDAKAVIAGAMAVHLDDLRRTADALTVDKTAPATVRQSSYD
jgi:hypothetical protein